MVSSKSKKYTEYSKYVRDLLYHPDVLHLNSCRHHYGVSRMQHAVNVSYCSYRISKGLGLDEKSIARAALLHDLFHYECKEKHLGFLRHAALHPRIALQNARRITPLSPLEEDIILNHMWLCGKAIPRYKESYIVSLVDKFAAVYEALYGIRRKLFCASCS